MQQLIITILALFSLIAPIALVKMRKVRAGLSASRLRAFCSLNEQAKYSLESTLESGCSDVFQGY